MEQRKAEAWDKWRGLVSEQSGSGLSVAAFCRERQVGASQLFAWKKRLREAEAAKFVEVRPAPGMAQRSVGEGSVIEVRLGGGRSLLVGPGFDGSQLRALLSVLEGGA